MNAWPKAVTAERRDFKREEILRVAADLFARKGFRATTMDELAESFGVTKQALYYYVASKEQVLIDLHARAFETLRAAVSESSKLADDPIERMRFLIARHIDVATSPEHSFLSVAPTEYPDHPTFKEQVLLRASEQLDAWVEIIEDGKRRGAFRDGLDSRIAALGIIGMCSWSSRWYRPTGRLSPAEIADQFATLVLSSLVKRSADPVGAG